MIRIAVGIAAPSAAARAVTPLAFRSVSISRRIAPTCSAAIPDLFCTGSVAGPGPGLEDRRVEISSVPLRSRHRAIGMFGIALPRSLNVQRPARLAGRLTARQHEILVHLAEGESTDQIAALLFLSRETVRNHIRHILRRLGTSSRLEAVAVARREEIL